MINHFTYVNCIVTHSGNLIKPCPYCGKLEGNNLSRHIKTHLSEAGQLKRTQKNKSEEKEYDIALMEEAKDEQEVDAYHCLESECRIDNQSEKSYPVREKSYPVKEKILPSQRISNARNIQNI